MVDTINHKIATVVCAYNNKDSIVKVISALLSQKHPIKEIIVVDNASSDGTSELVKSQYPIITLLSNNNNLGVGGGYARGMEYAYHRGYDWIWLLDGDSIPHELSLKKLIDFFPLIKNKDSKVGILAPSTVNSITGLREYYFMTQKFIKQIEKSDSSESFYFVDSVISSGSLINRNIIRDVGLPRIDFFMDFVDYEYNLRVKKNGYKIVYIPSSIIYHCLGETKMIRKITKFWKKFPSPLHVPWRLYYMTRNELYIYLYIIPSFRALVFYVGRILRTTIAILLKPEIGEKISRVKYIFLGLKDGVRGRLGKIVLHS